MTTVDASLQVTHPVVLFQTDNNGVILNFPAVSGAQPTVDGTMTFGIGTESNNGLGTATVYTMDTSDSFTTIFSGQTLQSSFIDSGSNGFFFPSSLTVCPGSLADFYCPSSIQNLSAINQGATQGTGTVNFSIDNASNLFNTNDAAYGDLGGPNGTYPCTASTCSFDWGLPFFFGKTVFTAVDGQPVPSGQPAAPWWAY